jgi:alkylation response protein AidB-like acyl-CoA dehydrogenase
MFKVIEYARMLVGTEAIATLSTGSLDALAYAKERVQGPDLTMMTDKSAAGHHHPSPGSPTCASPSAQRAIR